MTRFALRAPLLLVLALTLACGRPGSRGSTSDSGASLPRPGASWIAGTRAAPTAGRIEVGLLVSQREPRRLADLIPAEKLRAFLAEKQDAPEEEPLLLEGREAEDRTWGSTAVDLLDAAKEMWTAHRVEVVYREVLADECDGLPLIVVGARRLHAPERRALATQHERGATIVRLGTSLVAGPPPAHAEVVREGLAKALADSPRVHVLPVDPLAAEGLRDGDDIVLTLPHAGTSVTLEDADGRALATTLTGADGTARLGAPDPGLDPFSHHVVVRWESDGLTLARARPLADLVGAVDLVFAAAGRVHAGGAMALRVVATRAGEPVRGRRGRVELVREGSVLVATDYETDADGLAHPRLALPPEVAPGPAILSCDGVEHAVTIASGLRLSVVTDRPLYKQADAVHVRVMAHRLGDGRPVAGQAVVLSLGEAKREVTTSEHGIASHTFDLVEHRVGAAAVRAESEGVAATCAFRVKAFERPTFTVRAEPAELTLRPGEAAPVVLHAAYVNGSPFVGGRLAFDADGAALEDEPAQFNATGAARVVVRAPTRGAGGDLHVAVEDAEGRRVELAVPLTVEREGPALGLWPVSDVAVGVPAVFLVQGTQAGTLRLGGDFEGPDTVDLDDTHRALVTLTPRRAQLTVRVIPPGGTSLERTFRAQQAGDDGLVMALGRRAARVGEALRMDFVCDLGMGRVDVDVWREATVVRTLSVPILKGRGQVGLPLDASMAGVLQVFARRSDGKGEARRATVLVTRGRALEVGAQAAQETYVPGATAEVDVTVRDAGGKPTAAVLGYWGVDEALLALAPPTTGHERVFDVASVDADQGEHGLAEDADRGELVLSGVIVSRFHDDVKGVPTHRDLPIRLERTEILRKAALAARTRRVDESVKAIWDAYAAAWKDLAVTDLVSADSVRETLQWLARRGRLDPTLLLDPWGTPYRLWSDRRSVAIQWDSAGPDRTFGTADDVGLDWDGDALYRQLPLQIRRFHTYVRLHYEAPIEEDTEEVGGPIIKDEELFDMPADPGAWDAEFDGGPPAGAILGEAFEGPAENGTIGIGGGAGGAFRGRGGRRDLGVGGGGRGRSGEAPVHMRTDFDPTLCFVPEAIVGPDGKARLQIPLKDSMTTWRLRLVASDATGATGVGTGTIRVKQPVHATPWLAPHLTVGDVVEVPVAIRNEEAFAVDVDVNLAASDAVRVVSPATVTVPVAPGATGRAIFRLEALRAGRVEVEIAVDTGGAEDHQRRVLTVHPDARAVVATASGSITADAAFASAMPTPGAGQVRLDLYPSPLAEVLSGFDGLIAAPHG